MLINKHFLPKSQRHMNLMQPLRVQVKFLTSFTAPHPSFHATVHVNVIAVWDRFFQYNLINLRIRNSAVAAIKIDANSNMKCV